MKYKEIIYVKKEEAEKYDALLADENILEEDMLGKDNVIDSFGVEFSNGVVADIQMCAGNHNYYVNPVLFSEDGDEICFLDCEDDLLGEYCFEVDEDSYTIELVAEDK